MWFLNLQADPRCRVQVGSEADDRVARIATEEEVTSLWPRLLEIYSDFDTYKARAGDANRTIPVIFLDPA
jgi:deazaflavin-dependent oxidoreductase (nitroreductase family)